MAGIEEYLNQIENAIYGRDVRQAIHDGIEACYEDGKVGAVDLVARQRIDNLAHLDDGSTTGDAELADIRVDNYGKTWGDAGSAVRGQVKGIQNSLYHMRFNVLDFIKKTNEVKEGVTYTWNDDGTCTVRGTSTGTSFNNIFYAANAFPLFIHAGQYASVRITSDSDDSKVNYEIFKVVNGSLNGQWVGLTPAYQGDGCYQGYIPDNLSGILIRISVSRGNTVNETVRPSFIPGETMANNPNPLNRTVSDANEAKTSGIYFVSTGGASEPLINFPYATPGWLEVETIGDKTSVGVLQRFYPWASSGYDAWWRTCQSGGWNDWKKIGSGGGGGDTYIENTYNITTSPHITTDANGWLQPVDTNTADETGKTDMTGAIMSMLTDTGYCHLAKGIYYVSGNIDMPDGSTLEGCGEDTIIRLLSSVESGYCVKVTKYNTVKGIRFSGAYSDISVASETVGDRDAIRFIGSYDGQGQVYPTVEPNMITNCFFENFSGSAIHCHNTGGGTKSSLMVSDCYIRQCIAGINIDYFSEYSKFTNVITYKCHYACINNGGNNVFTACTFHGTIGFSMDGSRNSAHGSVVGCTFNHIDNWNRPSTLGGGTAILVKNAANGFIFTGCQIWYGAIDVRSSRGMAFSDCLIGGNSPEISVTGGYPAFFANCIFHSSPTLTVNSATKFDNCYLDSDGSVVGA